MSLYSLRINNDFKRKVLVIADYPHLHEARQGITEWAKSEYAAATAFEVGFITHDTDVNIHDLSEMGYISIKVL